MSEIRMSLKHGRTLAEARTCLGQAVAEARSRFGPLMQREEWAAGGEAVRLSGPGFQVDLRVDAQDVHVTGDIPLLGRLLAGGVLPGLKGLVEGAFQKRLTEDGGSSPPR